MIFDPEYSGVCSWRIGGLTSLNTSVCPSGDQPRPPIACSSERTTTVSLPSASVRTTRSPEAPPAPRPRPPRPAAVPAPGVVPAAPLTNATRVPSGDGTMLDSMAGVVQTADARPPSIGARHRSPFFTIISARPSLLQNAPVSCPPAPGSSRGGADAAASTTYTFDTPARSQTN